MIAAFLRAVPQILLPGVRSVLIGSWAITALLFTLLGGLAWLGLRWAFEALHWTALEGFGAAASAVLLAAVLGWFLFRALAIAVVGLFTDRIVAAVERADYPARHAGARTLPFHASLHMALRSLGRAIGWNLAALPLIIALLVTGVGAVALLILLNAYLLGRDLADLIEPRHPDMPPFSRGERWQIGLVSALLLLLPVVNLLAPVWSVAMAVHFFHRRAAPAL